MKTIVEYVRCPWNPSQLIGTVAAVQLEDGRVGVGFSQCHPDDVFVKKVGRDKAIGRATASAYGRDLHDKYGFILEPVPVKGFNVDGTRRRFNPVGAVLGKVRSAAYRIWNDATVLPAYH